MVKFAYMTDIISLLNELIKIKIFLEMIRRP